jgi:hypothetical protein
MRQGRWYKVRRSTQGEAVLDAWSKEDPSASSLGGYPILPGGQAWPVCVEDGCTQKMSLFFQFDIADSLGLTIPVGATLTVFQCLIHDDPFEPLDTLFPKKSHKPLPENYRDHQNYAIFLRAPGDQRQVAEQEPWVEHSRLHYCQPRGRGRAGSTCTGQRPSQAR